MEGTLDDVVGAEPSRSRLRQVLLTAAEVGLILLIIGLLVAIWLPGWVGPHPGLQPPQ